MVRLKNIYRLTPIKMHFRRILNNVFTKFSAIRPIYKAYVNKYYDILLICVISALTIFAQINRILF